MKIRFTRLALEDLDSAYAFVAETSPGAAATLIERIERAIEGLRAFPERGRPGRIDGTRELVVPRTPFVVPYRVGSRTIDVLAVIHASRRWPTQL